MLPLYWWALDLDPQQRALAEWWVRRFAEIIAAPPFGVSCDVRCVDTRLESRLFPALTEADVRHVASATSDVLFDECVTESSSEISVLPKLVVFCTEANDLVAKLRASNPRALWGGASGVCFAVVNHFEPTVVWHELFHLLGAEDCYDENNADEDATPCCGNRNCLMKYAPTLETVGDPPFLCETNVRRVRKMCSSISTEGS